MTEVEEHPKRIENVRCVKVGGGEHRFEAPDVGQARHLKVFIAVGYNRPSNVVVGDVGRMIYKSTRSQGLWWFEKY